MRKPAGRAVVSIPQAKLETENSSSENEMEMEERLMLEEKKDEVMEEEKPKSDKAATGKNVYLRIDVSKKLDLALYCRDFHLEKNRNPMCKELRIRFP